jgi:hypothetical protein
MDRLVLELVARPGRFARGEEGEPGFGQIEPGYLEEPYSRR